MPISELNSHLLQLLRDYKQAMLYREVYKALLVQSAPALPQPKIQAALDAFQPLLDRKFLQAEKTFRCSYSSSILCSAASDAI
jgi:hypothetical protein